MPPISITESENDIWLDTINKQTVAGLGLGNPWENQHEKMGLRHPTRGFMQFHITEQLFFVFNHAIMKIHSTVWQTYFTSLSIWAMAHDLQNLNPKK